MLKHNHCFHFYFLKRYSIAYMQMTNDGLDKRLGSKFIIICRNHNSVLSSCAMYDVLDYSVLSFPRVLCMMFYVIAFYSFLVCYV